MFGFHSRKPQLGLDINGSEIKLAAIAGPGPNAQVLCTASAALPAGAMNETFSSPSLVDPGAMSDVLRELLSRQDVPRTRRVGLSLPDALFRVQGFEFDSLPQGAADRERLIRWRFERSSAFDVSDTLLRYQIVQQRERGAVLLASIAKRQTIRQYEDLLLGLGLDPWTIGPASFHAVNLFSPAFASQGPGRAVVVVRAASFVTMVVDNGLPRFYRLKEIKAGSSAEMRDRLVREIDDSLHFYMHMDRSQQVEIGRIGLTGDIPDLSAFASRLGECSSIPIDILSPSDVLVRSDGGELPAALTAALGAGRMAA